MNELDLMQAMDGIEDEILLEAETFTTARQAPDPRRFRLMRVAAAVLVLAMLAGCVAGSLQFSLYSGSATPSWNEAEWIASKHDLQLPDTLLGAPFLDCQVLCLTEVPTSWLLAMLLPDYRYYTVAYGTECIQHDPDSGASWTDRNEVITMTFGSTGDEVWRRQFGFNDQDAWIGTELTRSEIVATQTLTLEGMTVYLATYASTSGNPRHTLSWYDSEDGLAFRLAIRAESWDSLLTAAEEIMACNP